MILRSDMGWTRGTVFLAALGVAQAAWLTPAGAEEPGGATAQPVHLKPVTVTAEKMAADEQDTPVSMTVVTGEELERTSAQDTGDIVRRVPNTYMTKAGRHSSVAFVSMRGVTPFMEAEQPVGFFVDGVTQRNIDLELLDIDRVEVLRGPQSTLYGRNTEAGAINVITRDPEPVDEGAVSVTLGNYDRRSVTGIAGGAVGNDDWSYRAAIRLLDTDGYFRREPGDIDTVDDATDLNARLKLRWHPLDRWDVIATYEGQRYRDGSTNIAPLSQLRATPHVVTTDYIGSNDSDVHNGNLRAVYEAANLTVTSISAYTDEAKLSTYDVDGTANPFMTLRTDVDYARFTQELRVSSPETAKGPRWVGGVYYFDQTDHNNFDMDMAGMGAGVQHVRTTTDTRNMAAFGQVNWPLWEDVSLIAGLRYDHERKEATNRQVYRLAGRDFRNGADMTFDAWLPKIGLEYAPMPGLMTYATYSEGYKSGGFNNLADPGEEVYDAEYTTNYEVGVKASAFDDRLRARLAAFWIDWTDQQVEELILSQSNISNAGTSVSRGVELEMAWQATRDLRLIAGGGWNDAHFKRYEDGGVDYSGKRPPNAPAYTYSLGVDYQRDDGFFARADWLGTGRVYFNSANTQRQDSYGLLNLRAGYDIGDYGVALWMKNALDETYATRAFDLGGGTYGGIAGDPRTFGLTVTARW